MSRPLCCAALQQTSTLPPEDLERWVEGILAHVTHAEICSVAFLTATAIVIAIAVSLGLIGQIPESVIAGNAAVAIAAARARVCGT